MSKKRFYVGIDPGVNTGWASWDSESKQFLNIYTTNFWDCITALKLLPKEIVESCCVIIEDPNLNRPTFDRPGQNNFAMRKIAQNVGSNKRDAQLIIEWLEANKFEVIKVKPTTGKWDSKTFKSITKWEGSTNEHGRDAAKLIFGR